MWWLSLTPPGDLPWGVGMGFVIQEAAYILAMLGFVLTLFTRTPEQIALAEERRHAETEREASNEQATILAKQRAEEHPLLADDRRARAHNRRQSSYGRDTKK